MNENQQSHVWLLAAVAVAGVFYLMGQRIAVHSESTVAPNITVSGTSKVSAAPDIASLSFGVTTGRRQTAKDAMAVLSRQMDAVIAAVKEAGIADKDLTTEQFSLSPVYNWSNNQQTIIGYEATQSLSAKVRELDNVPDVLAAATGAGANQAGSVNFTIDDPEKVRAEAREKAIEVAKEKAQVLARQLGLHLGKIVSFNEDGGYTPPMPYARMAMDDMKAEAQSANLAMPIGEQDVNVTVSITYELY